MVRESWSLKNRSRVDPLKSRTTNRTRARITNKLARFITLRFEKLEWYFSDGCV